MPSIGPPSAWSSRSSTWRSGLVSTMLFDGGRGDLPPESNDLTCQGMIASARFTATDKPLPPKITTTIRYRIARDGSDTGDTSEIARR